jgi:uncharacterized membrane protein
MPKAAEQAKEATSIFCQFFIKNPSIKNLEMKYMQ